jgi:WD40 repeat protein
MQTESEALNPVPPLGPLKPGPPFNGSLPAAHISIPDHQLVRRIGSGSYGEVWLAQHTMGMLRAVKIVYRASFQDERPFERELSGIRKFEPISRSHEGFVDILHVGINAQQGYFYYVMELADDQALGQQIEPATYRPKTLAQEIAQGGHLSLAECMRLGLALSQALAALHQHGLVHRDIKPSNVVFVNGVPKLADIGLVAEIEAARSYVGTEGFIPPEGPGTPAADVYGLGKVLYEACTGQDRKEFPTLPDWWDRAPELAGLLEFNELLIQACQPEPAKRYHSARELHADLLLLENGRSLKRLRLLERRLASFKRVAGLLALVSLVLGLVAYESYQEWRRNIEARQRQVGADLAYGNRALEAGEPLGALPYFADALRLDQGNRQQERNHRLRFGASLAQAPKLTHMWFLPKQCRAAQFSPDGQRLLVAEYFGQAHIFDLQSGQPCSPPFEPIPALADATYSPDGRWIATASDYGSVGLWEARSLKQVRSLPHPGRVHTCRFSPDGQRLVSAGGDGLARVWAVPEGRAEPLLLLKRHVGPVRFATFSHDGRLLITTGEDGKAYLWAAGNGQPLGPPLEHQTWITYAAFSPDDRLVVTASEDHLARVWEVATGKQFLLDLPHQDAVRSAEFSPDGRLLVTADLSGEVHLWDAQTLQPLAANSVLRHSERAFHAGFSPEGHRLLTCLADGSVRLWDLAGRSLPPRPVQGAFSRDGSRWARATNGTLQVRDSLSNRPVSPVLPLAPLAGEPALSAHGNYLQTVRAVAAGAGATNYLVQVWDILAAHPISPELVVSNTFQGAALSPDGTRLVTFGGVKAQLWEVQTGQPLGAPLLHGAAVEAALFSPGGERLATRSANQVQVWDARSGQPAGPALKHPVGVSDMQFNPQGSRLVTCCTDDWLTKCFAQVWDAATGQAIGPPLKHGDGVLQAVFSPDGSRVVTASEDFTAIVWEATTGHQLTPALKHRHQVQAAAFSPDGQWVVTGSSDKTARIWSADTGDPLTPPLWHPEPLTQAQFLADGRHLLTTGFNERTWLWPLPLDERPVEDLLLLAHLLSGGAPDASQRFAPSRPESTQATWERLRAKYPADFITSAEAVAEWDEFQAQQNEAGRHWFAAAFHLAHLQALRPADSSLAQRLASAQAHLKRVD